MPLTYYRVTYMSTSGEAVRRSARRIGVENGANFDERREIVLREATRAFNERGVQNTSLDDVATRIGVTKPALYHYVASKDEMISQCLTVALNDYRELLDEADDMDCSGIEKLRFVFEGWAAIAATDFGRAILTIDSRVLAEESRRTHDEAHRVLLRRVEKLIQDGIGDGSVRECNTRVITLSLVGLFNSTASWFRAEGPLSVEQAAREMLILMENGLATNAA